MLHEHEKQVMKNHGGQTTELVCSRGGLDWVELMYVLTDTPYTKRISEGIAIDIVSRKIDKFIEEYGDASKKIPLNNKLPLNSIIEKFGYKPIKMEGVD